jgi:hypothetical protein
VVSGHIERDAVVLCVATEKGNSQGCGGWDHRTMVVGGAAVPGSPPWIMDGHRDNGGTSND